MDDKDKVQFSICSRADDFRKLIHIFSDEFGEPPRRPATHQTLQLRLEDTRFIVAVASLNQEIVGGTTIYLLPGYQQEVSAGYLYDVAVKSTYQGQGIGRKLIEFVIKTCRDRGVSEMFVQAVDGERSVKFYQQTAPSEEINVRMFIYRL